MGTKNKSQNCVHILNGDALLEQFPRDLKGASIVFRECLVDGPVTANSLNELYQKRSAFFAQTYQLCTPIEYEERIVSEFNKVQKIPNGSEINLWFEDDLFCQVNCWFVCYLLRDIKDCDLYLVRPNNQSPYAFSVYTETELTNFICSDRYFLLPFFWHNFGKPMQQETSNSSLYSHSSFLMVICMSKKQSPHTFQEFLQKTN